MTTHISRTGRPAGRLRPALGIASLALVTHLTAAGVLAPEWPALLPGWGDQVVAPFLNPPTVTTTALRRD